MKGLALKVEDEKVAEKEDDGCIEVDPATDEEAGVKTITVPSTVVLKLRNPRTVTVGRPASPLFWVDPRGTRIRKYLT